MIKKILIVLLAVGFTTNCAKKKDNKSLWLLLLALSNQTVDSAEINTIPSRLNIVDVSPSVSTSNSLNSSYTQTKNIVNLIKNNALTDITNKSSAYYADKPSIYSQDPITQSFQMIDFFMQIFDLGGVRLLSGKGAYRGKFTMPTASGSSSAENSQKKDTYTFLSESNVKDDTNVSVLRKFTAWGPFSGGKITLVAFVYEPISVKLVTIDGIESKVQSGGKYTMKIKLEGSFNVNCIVKSGKENGVDKLQFYYIISSNQDTYEYNAIAEIDSANDTGVLSTGYTQFQQGRVSLNGKAVWDKNFIYVESPGQSTNVYSLSRKDINRTVDSYGLYNQDGSRLNLRTGISVKNSSGDNGWASKWGVYLYNSSTYQQVTLSNGQSVSEMKFDGTVGESFTVNNSSGQFKLYKLDGTLVPFDEPLNFNINDGSTTYEAWYYGFGRMYVPWVQNSNDYMGYAPVTTITNGIKLSPKNNSNSYYVKQLSIGIKFNKTTQDLTYLKNKAVPTLLVPSTTDLTVTAPSDPLEGKDAKTCVLDGKLLDSNGRTVETVQASVCN